MSYHVYRLFDNKEVLLYVGYSLKPAVRINAHRRKWWGSQIARSHIEGFPSEVAARSAERRAIQNELPRWNQVHHPDPLPLPVRQIKQQLPDDLHKWLRIRALENDQTLSETIIELLEKSRKEETQ